MVTKYDSRYVKILAMFEKTYIFTSCVYEFSRLFFWIRANNCIRNSIILESISFVTAPALIFEES